jgi:hypothetical protein
MKSDREAAAEKLLVDFLAEQEHAFHLLKNQYPGEEVDLYQDRMEDLFANLRVLMYYRITPARLQNLLELYKGHSNFRLLDETNLNLESCAKVVENLQILLYKQGQLRSFLEGEAVDAQGSPIPWITYPALEFFAQFDFSESDVLELGAGNSTLYWSARARKIVSVETERQWFETLKQRKKSNVQVILASGEREFVECIQREDNLFDVIVVDSLKYRYVATLNAVSKLAPGGIVIFDNSDWYPNSCRLLRDAGFLQIDFHGFGPVNGYAWATSIFFKDSIKFRRADGGLSPIGGVTAHIEDDSPTSVGRS